MQEFRILFKRLIQRQQISACHRKLSLPANGHHIYPSTLATSQACHCSFSTSTRRPATGTHVQEAKELNTKGLNDQAVQEKVKQVRTPWHREGSDVPPVGRQRSAGAMTKGELVPMCLYMAMLI